MLKLIEFVEVKSHIFLSEIENRKIYNIDNLLFNVKKNFEVQARKIEAQEPAKKPENCEKGISDFF